MFKIIIMTCVIICLHGAHGQQDRQRGAFIGSLNTLSHEVSGDVHAADTDKLYIENFSYDGEAPDAFFWIGKGNSGPDSTGTLVSYPCRSSDPSPLTKFDGENVLIQLPQDVSVENMNWFSVWCREYEQNFGSVNIPAALQPPSKVVLPEFKRLAHGLRSGNITILDSRTFRIPDLHYDGTAPAAYFWVGNGTNPDQNGQKIPDEDGSSGVLKEYTGQTIQLRLPEGMTVYDIEYLGMWCVQFSQNFGHVQLPKSLWVPPALPVKNDCEAPDDNGNNAASDLGPRGLVYLLIFTTSFYLLF